jgi:transcriptional regulator with XRE-family HTH domain
VSDPPRYQPAPIKQVDQQQLAAWEADALRTGSRTRLAIWRLRRGLTQRRLAQAVGMSLAGYRRLERDQVADPSVRDLANLALALGVDLTDLLEPSWVTWRPPDAKLSKPPVSTELWRQPPGQAP